MNAICKTSVAVVAVFLFIKQSTAQSNGAKYEIGVNTESLVYVGDLSKTYLGNFRGLKSSFGLSVTRILSPYLAVSAHLNKGGISADESTINSPEWRQHRNFSFSTPVTELYSTISWNILGEQNNYNYRRLSAFLFVGAGASFLNVKRNWSKIDQTYFDVKSATMVGLGLDTVQSTPKVIGILPVGAGMKYAINSNWAVNATFTYRLTTTDYLDGFKYAANANKRDGYYGVSVGVTYQFTKNKYGCPKWSSNKMFRKAGRVVDAIAKRKSVEY